MNSKSNLEESNVNLEKFLSENFGFRTFRNDQLSIIISVLKKQDLIALLPTGGGKSLCYQFPTLYKKLKTIVVSPLLALIEDQVASAKKHNISAWSVTSSYSSKDNFNTLSEFKHSPYGILFISPERIASSSFVNTLEKIDVDLIAIDEAHCISKWGFDFRPSYREIINLKNYLPDAAWMALTATATQQVIADIQMVLKMQDPVIIRKSFVRENIDFQVIKSNNPNEVLIEKIKGMVGSGIVYCRNRIKTEDTASILQINNIRAAAYHAGMAVSEKKRIVDDWMNEKFQIMVSTNAFGMGIDKSGVRMVIHLDIPPSIEEYYQEAGRAGRDGKPSKAILIISENEGKRALTKNEKYIIEEHQLRNICRILNEYFSEQGEDYLANPVYFIRDKTKIHPIKIIQGLNILEQCNFISLSEGLQNPSRIRFEKSPAQKSIYRDKNIGRYLLADYCLNRYENLFNSWVIIDEYEISVNLNIEQIEIVKMFDDLEKDGVLKYLPASGPQVIQLKTVFDDVTEEMLFKIDYQYTKQSQLTRVIEYCESDMCRTQFLLNYFNEDANACGHCDNCINGLRSNHYNTFDEYLDDVLNKKEPTIKEVLENAYLTKEKTIQRLQYLATERIIKIIGQKIVKKNR